MKNLILISISLLVAQLSFGQTAEEYFKSGNQKLDSNDYRGAILDFTKAIEFNPNDAYAYNGRGVSNYYIQDYRRAILDYNKAIELNSNDADAYFGRGAQRMTSKTTEELF